jgi:peptidyl-prolyl cis-trans isomerase C
VKALFALIILAANAAVAQQTKPAAPAAAPSQAAAPQAGADPIIIKAGPMQIHQSEFETAIKSLPAEYQSYAMGAGRKRFAEDLVRMKVLAAEAVKNGIPSDPDFQAQLGIMRENLLATAQLARLEKTTAVSDAEIQKAFDEHKKDYDQAKARHILVAFKGSQAAQPGKKELTDAEAKAKAEEIRKKIVGGADFAELAKQESDDKGSAARGGDLGSFGRGHMVPEFEKVVWEAKIGEVSPVIRTDYGYHIVQVQERTEATVAQVRPALEKELKQKKVQDQLEAIKNSVQPEYDSAYFAPPPPPAPAPAPAAAPGSTPAPASTPSGAETPKQPAAKEKAPAKKP